MSRQEGVVTAPIIIHEEITPERVLLECRVPPDLVYFHGHFADVSVVPGVCQIKWVVDTVARTFGRSVSLAGMEAVKFHQLLFPDDSFLMEIKRVSDGAKWSYRITSGDRKIASGRLVDRLPDSGEDHESQL